MGGCFVCGLILRKLTISPAEFDDFGAQGASTEPPNETGPVVPLHMYRLLKHNLEELELDVRADVLVEDDKESDKSG